jgi:hypothetical protein
MVYAAMRRVDDAMAAGLEETDLRIIRFPSHRESCAMAMAQAGRRMDPWFG